MLGAIAGFAIGGNAEWWRGALAFAIWCATLAAAGSEQGRFERIRHLIAMHAEELAIRRRRGVIAGRYGVIDAGAWDKEVDFFIERVIAPAHGPLPIASNLYRRIRVEIESTAASA